MKTLLRQWITMIFIVPISMITAQDLHIGNDSVCVTLGGNINYYLSVNDSLGQFIGEVEAYFLDPPPCIQLDNDPTTGQLGVLSFSPDANEMCCGQYQIPYSYRFRGTTVDWGQGTGILNLTIKCPKPDCGLVDLTDWINAGSAAGVKPQINACENSEAVYFIDPIPGAIITWVPTNGTLLTLGNSNMETILWDNGPVGTITIDITIGSVTQSTVICVDLLSSPVADFMPLDSCACLNSPITFINNSIGGSSYHWNFGDGNTSSAYQPTHTYASAGVYTVTLVVTKDNVDVQGNPLCCCVDSISKQIEIDPRPGPDIYWISTLCPEDSSKYWTDLAGCTLTWLVEDANGSTLSFSGQGNDTICVSWGDGPYGVVTLTATGCPAVCNKPVSAIVPIIETNADIEGEQVVCEFSTYTYEVPKWPSVSYDWTATGAIAISGNGSHTVDITWGASGPGHVHVDYCSEFLNGLPIHMNEECCGSADLPVNIKPEYSLVPPASNIACVGDTSTFSTSHPTNSFTWMVNPPASLTVLGPGTIEMVWPAAGIYQIKVYPNGVNPFCNDTLRYTMIVKDLNTVDSITGQSFVCDGVGYPYFAHSDDPGVGYKWTVIGGMPLTYTGNPVEVVWNPTGPHKLCVEQFLLNDPGCSSDTICVDIYLKTIDGPLAITGPTACVNTIQSYSVGPAQTYDVDYEWMIMPTSAGSVVTNPDSNTVMIQWNDTPGPAVVTAKITLCNSIQTTSITVNVNPQPTPNITQTGSLCPGGSATLHAGVGGPGYTYNWSPGSGASISHVITTPGVYTLTVTDNLGCTKVASYEAFSNPGPPAMITSPNFNPICINGGGNLTMHTLDHPDYTFEWYCGGVLQTGIPAGQSFFTHVNTNTVGTFQYYVKVTDTSTGCMTISPIYIVSQVVCGSGPGCTPQMYSLIANGANDPTFCNNVTFTVTNTPNVTLGSWNYGDGNTGTSYTHTYLNAGFYIATLNGSVPNQNGPGNCAVSDTVGVEIPLAAYFDYTIDCDKVTFNDLSSFLVGHDINMWNWTFGTMGTSTMTDPMVVFTSPGPHLVTLTVTSVTGCQATYSDWITVYGLPNPVITAMPDTVCVEEDICFTVSTTGAPILDYQWSFGDLSTNGSATPKHAYLSPGNYTVGITVTDLNGCTGTDDQQVVVHPAPMEGPVIIAPDDVICEGQSATLTASGGVVYEWSDGFIGNPNIVMVAGDYAVTVTDINGCSYVADPVTITVLPPLVAEISGDTVICGTGCVTLYATTGYNFTYQWLDAAGSPIPGAVNASFQICDYAFYPMVSVVITDDNGCVDTSDVVSISIVTPPTVGIALTGDGCEGTQNVLMATPILPNVIYSWGSSGSGTTITTSIPGVYTVYALDTLTGCSASASIQIYPWPDLCLVPTGCYEVCNPDTICGPPGLASYQWNMNGLPIAGETNQCLIVEASGSYSLTASNSFNCYNTSDTLILEVIPCCDKQAEIFATSLGSDGDTCCFEIGYASELQGLDNVLISVASGYLNPPSNVNPGFMVISNTPTGIILGDISGANIPTGTISELADICIYNGVWPNTLYFYWRDGSDTVCVDSLVLDCEPEPPCLYQTMDSTYCIDDQMYLEITVCNPSSADFAVGYVDINVGTPLSATVAPTSLVLSPPLLPGDCRDLVFQVNGIMNSTLCYNILAHEADPEKVDSAQCCSLDTSYCVFVPGCSPCDSLYVGQVTSVDSCCYDIPLINYSTQYDINRVDLCILNPGSTMAVDPDLTGTGWSLQGSSPSIISLLVDPSDAILPMDTTWLPELCLTSAEEHFTLVEVKWMHGDEIECRDTIAMECPNDCGYLTPEIICEGEGWLIQFSITNTSTDTIGSAYVHFEGAGLDAYDTSIPLGLLPPGATSGLYSIYLGPPATPGSMVSLNVILHAVDHTNAHTNCCDFDQMITLPICNAGEPDCDCDKDFKDQVALGAIVDFISGSTATLTPAGMFGPCDKIIWDWVYQTLPTSNMTMANEAVTHTFPDVKGEYRYCMTVIRTLPNGKQCKAKYFGEVEIGNSFGFRTYPNPASGLITYEFGNQEVMGQPVLIELFNRYGQKVTEISHPNASETVGSIDVSELVPGVYLLKVNAAESSYIRRVMVIK